MYMYMLYMYTQDIASRREHLRIIIPAALANIQKHYHVFIASYTSSCTGVVLLHPHRGNGHKEEMS